MKIRRLCRRRRSLLLFLLFGSVLWILSTNRRETLTEATEYLSAIGPPCLELGVHDVKTEPAFDLLSLSPPEYLHNYRNPCWHGDPKLFRNNSLRLLCVPIFYVAGQPKCGTTDLFYKLTLHPEIADRNYYSAMHWLTRARFSKYIKKSPPAHLARKTFYSFARFFTNNTQQISRGSSSSASYHRMIIGDASPSTFSDHAHWEEFIGNENCQQPRIINSVYLRHIVPNAKVIVTLRNPVSRLYSSYYFFLHKGTPEDFHERAVREVTLYTDCFKQHSVRQCAYNTTLSQLSQLTVGKGLYSVYLEDWFKTFPREQMFISFLEEYGKNPAFTLKRIFKFLNVSPLSEEELKRIATTSTKNVGRLRKKSNQMLEKTKKFLNKFYKPFNARLKELMLDKPNPS